MSSYPVNNLCPSCGCKDFVKRGGARVCGNCSSRYKPPPSPWARLLFGIIFIVPGVILTIAASGCLFGTLTDTIHHRASAYVQPKFVGFVVFIEALGLVCIGWGFKELKSPPVPAGKGGKPGPARGRAAPATTVRDDDRDERDTRAVATVAKERAEALVRALAEKHRARGVLKRLGRFRPEQLANPTAHFAKEWRRGETPLVLVDRSFLHDGKSGLLVTNRRLYSSLLRRPIPLRDIREVSYHGPTTADLVILVLLGGLYVLFRGWRHFRHRLVVNGELVYEGQARLRPAFWVEMLTALGTAARETLEGPPPPVAADRALVVVTGPPAPLMVTALETFPHSPEGKPLSIQLVSEPTWADVERKVRELDGHANPLVRLWAGDPAHAPALEVRGGGGKYVLRERGDGWVYYDAAMGDEEVTVQTSGGGHRCPAFYVCTERDRVLQIARRFCETGQCVEQAV